MLNRWSNQPGFHRKKVVAVAGGRRYARYAGKKPSRQNRWHASEPRGTVNQQAERCTLEATARCYNVLPRYNERAGAHGKDVSAKKTPQRDGATKGIRWRAGTKNGKRHRGGVVRLNRNGRSGTRHAAAALCRLCAGTQTAVYRQAKYAAEGETYIVYSVEQCMLYSQAQR